MRHSHPSRSLQASSWRDNPASRVLLLLLLCLAVSLPAWSQVAPTSDDWSFFFSIRGYQAGERFTEPSALAINLHDSLLYVADRAAGRVSIFSLRGLPRGQYGAADGVTTPIGVAADRHGTVFIANEEKNSLTVLPQRGNSSTLDLPVDAGMPAPQPGRMTIDRDDNLYVIDRANARVCVFDAARKFKFALGSLGDKPGQFKLLQDVAVDRQGRIYALDATGTPVQVFDRNGNFLYGFGKHGEGTAEFTFPVGVFIDRNTRVWIVDREQHLLKVFDRSGAFLHAFGTYGQQEGALFHPIDAVTDDFAHIFVFELGARRLQVFTLPRSTDTFNLGAT